MWHARSLRQWALIVALSPISVVAQQSAPGAISGTLSYPSEDIPPLRVCAISAANASRYRCVMTKANQEKYRIDALGPGTYFVVAYPKVVEGWRNATPGAYSKMVPCGLRRECIDHTLIPVHVRSGETSRNIDPGDWYADSTTFPPEPPL